MFYIEDKVSATKQIQRFLFIEESGIFDDRTKNAVIEHQANNGILANGVIDNNTFLSIRNDYRQKKTARNVRDNTPFRANFPYKFGMFGSDVNILNSMLADAIDRYSLDIIKPRGEYYSRTTEDAVKALRKIYIIEDSGHIDEVFYDRLEKSIVRINY